MPDGEKKPLNPLLPSGGIWDAHVHCYPPEVIDDPSGWALRNDESHWLRLVTEGPQGWADPEALVRAMDASHVEKVLLQAWYWENPETARLQNRWHADWLAQYPDRFLACAAVHPDLPDLEQCLEQAKEWGACAVGECLPQVQTDAGWQHPGWNRILAWTSSHDWPFCLHITEPVGHLYPGRFETPLMDLVEVFESNPHQRFLCAHWGGGLPFYSLNRRVQKALRNVWFDSAASPLLYSSRVWRIACDLVGPEKIIFGSDFPLRLYPGKERQPGWKRFLEEFLGSGLSEDEIAAIGRNNLASLLDLA